MVIGLKSVCLSVWVVGIFYRSFLYSSRLDHIQYSVQHLLDMFILTIYQLFTIDAWCRWTTVAPCGCRCAERRKKVINAKVVKRMERQNKHHRLRAYPICSEHDQIIIFLGRQAYEYTPGAKWCLIWCSSYLHVDRASRKDLTRRSHRFTSNRSQYSVLFLWYDCGIGSFKIPSVRWLMQSFYRRPNHTWWWFRDHPSAWQDVTRCDPHLVTPSSSVRPVVSSYQVCTSKPAVSFSLLIRYHMILEREVLQTQAEPEFALILASTTTAVVVCLTILASTTTAVAVCFTILASTATAVAVCCTTLASTTTVMAVRFVACQLLLYIRSISFLADWLGAMAKKKRVAGRPRTPILRSAGLVLW